MFSFAMIYICIGVFAGLMAGILGIGGGIIVVPGLVYVFQHNHLIPNAIIMHAAAGTSLAIMVITSIAALIAHHKLGKILWPIFNKLGPGIALGTISGALLAQWIPTRWLEILFSLFLFFVAFKVLSNMHVVHTEKVQKAWVDRFVSYFIGLKSGLLGIGGGMLIIPYLTHCGIPARNIAPVSNLCTFTVGLAGAVAFMITGQNEMATVPYATGYVYWPAVLLVAISSSLSAPAGAKLNYVVPIKQLKYGFVVILVFTAINLLFF